MEFRVKIDELRKHKIFVATPMYGGNCSGMYTRSMCDLSIVANKLQIDLRSFFIFNESLITRARNYLVDEFLRTDCTHLMFIDSDIAFDPNDVITMLALNKDVVGAPYPKKSIAWEKVRSAVFQGKGSEDPTDLGRFTGDFVFNPTSNTGKIKIDEPVEVLEVGTGFMLIKREVFDKFKEAYPKYKYRPDHNRTEHFDGKRYIHAYFDTIIDNEEWMGSGAENTDRYLSEDYMFCQMVRKIGIKIWYCPWMNIGHVGNYVFNGSLSSFSEIGASTHMDIHQYNKMINDTFMNKETQTSPKKQVKKGK